MRLWSPSEGSAFWWFHSKKKLPSRFKAQNYNHITVEIFHWKSPRIVSCCMSRKEIHFLEIDAFSWIQWSTKFCRVFFLFYFYFIPFLYSSYIAIQHFVAFAGCKWQKSFETRVLDTNIGACGSNSKHLWKDNREYLRSFFEVVEPRGMLGNMVYFVGFSVEIHCPKHSNFRPILVWKLRDCLIYYLQSKNKGKEI